MGEPCVPNLATAESGSFELSWISWQTVMDVGGGNSSMARGDCDLVKVRHHIPGGIKPFYGSTLMAIDLETSHVCRGSA
jgi:hypothetical protein